MFDYNNYASLSLLLINLDVMITFVYADKHAAYKIYFHKCLTFINWFLYICY